MKLVKKIYEIFSKNYLKEIDSTGLAIFRIAYSLVLLGEIIHIFYFRHLIFDKIPYIDVSEIDFGIPIAIWGLSVILVMIGAYTRQAAILNYLMSIILIGTIKTYEYHMFYSYVAINFLLIFFPVSKRLSIDRLRMKLRYSSIKAEYAPPVKVSKLYYQLVILVGVGVVYLDSVFFKLTTNLWQSGLGVWLPANMPMTTHFDSTSLMNIKWLVIFLAYLTVVFEIVFPFLFWFKRFRIPFFIIGVGLHLGIIVEFPIPFFGFGVVAMYLLLLPVSIWGWFRKRANTSKVALTIYYDNECPLCLRTKLIIEHFDWFNKLKFESVQDEAVNEPALSGVNEGDLLNDIYSVDSKGRVYRGVDTYIQSLTKLPLFFILGYLMKLPGIYHLGVWVYNNIATNRTVYRCTEENCGILPQTVVLDDRDRKLFASITYSQVKIGTIAISVIVFAILQLIVSLNSPLVKNIRQLGGLKGSLPDNILTAVSRRTTDVTKVLFGITEHGLFVDSHFEGYNHIVGVTYLNLEGEDEWLPFITEKGQPGTYLYGFNWAKWTFRIVGPKVDQKKLANGLRDFTAFWAYKNNVDLKNSTFKVKVKKVDLPTGWKKNLLHEQMEHPWIDAGVLRWENKECTADIMNIESI